MTARKVESSTRQEGTQPKSRFSQELYSESRLRELRQRHASKGLTARESLELLLGGNDAHAQRLEDLGISPMARMERIRSGQADYLVIACSDARIMQLDSEEDQLVGVQIRVAGNVIPRKGTPSFDEIREAVGRLREDGIVIIEGHIHCGAVNERVKWVEGGMKPTGSTPLDNLLHEVFGSNPTDNAVGQLTKAREQLPLHNIASGAVLYNWETGDIDILGANHSPVLEMLVDSWKHRHSQIAANDNLAEELKKQKPHAIAVGEVGLPYSLMTIMRAKQNEVFSTSGSEGGLDDIDEASILYAVEHLGVRHIPFISAGPIEDEGRIGAMFDKWEADLRGMAVAGKPVLANMLDSGELAISRLRYDSSTGRLAELPAK